MQFYTGYMFSYSHKSAHSVCFECVCVCVCVRARAGKRESVVGTVARLRAGIEESVFDI